MNLNDFNITDNGDGTFTLTPKDGSILTKELVAEYRKIKEQGAALLAHRNQINTKLQALVARRDELKAIAQGAGVDPDTYVEPEEE